MKHCNSVFPGGRKALVASKKKGPRRRVENISVKKLEKTLARALRKKA